MDFSAKAPKNTPKKASTKVSIIRGAKNSVTRRTNGSPIANRPSSMAYCHLTVTKSSAAKISSQEYKTKFLRNPARKHTPSNPLRDTYQSFMDEEEVPLPEVQVPVATRFSLKRPRFSQENTKKLTVLKNRIYLQKTSHNPQPKPTVARTSKSLGTKPNKSKTLRIARSTTKSPRHCVSVTKNTQKI